MQNVIFMSAVTACLHALLVSAATNEFMIPENTGCVCSGTRLTYNCTITGMGNTEWSGTLFNCLANGIILRHERFSSEDVIGECNGGDVVARELGFSENCYTSELTFVANPSFNNKTVSCIHNSIEGDIIIGTSVISVEGFYPPPENIILSRVYQRMLTFNWSMSVPNCTQSSLSYGITSNCGSCPEATNATSATCSDVQLPPNESSCEFSVHTIVCENAGLSNSITVNFIAPDEPIVEIVPIYSSEDRALIGIVTVVNQKDRFNSTAIDNMAGIVESYNTYIDSTVVANNASCSSDECRYTTNVPSSLCDSSSSVSVAITAVNGVGRSPSTSNPLVVACTNEFVFIDYNSTTSTITCRFTSTSQSEGSQNTCSVHAGLCTALAQSVDSSRNTSSSANVTLHVSEADSVGAYCLTATNGTYTLMIERHNIRKEGGPPIITIIVVCVIASAILLAVAVIFCCCYWRCRKNNDEDSEVGGPVELKESQRFTNIDYQQLIQNGCLKPHDTNDSELIELSNDDNYRSVKDLLKKEKKELEYLRGHVYYEFSSDVECITKDKLLILKTSDERYSFLSTEMNDKLHGERVLKPILDNCLVFVQSTGSGLRCLPPHTKLIYEQTNPHRMWHVDKDRYKVKTIPRGFSVKQYCEDPGHQLDYKKGSVFVEYDRATDKSDHIESTITAMFIITRKVQGKEVYYTGSQARDIVDGSSEATEFQNVLTVMVNECEEFEKDTVIWYQSPSVTIVEGVIVIPIKSEQFTCATLKEKLKLKEFKKQHHLHANDLNVLVEIGWNELDKYKDKVVDTILRQSLMGKERYFSCDFHTLLNHCRDLILSPGAVQARKEWKVFVMCEFKEDHQLQKDLSILYQAWKPNGLLLIPDYSKHFIKEKQLQVEGEVKLRKFLKNKKLKRDEIDVFVKVECVPKQIMPTRDVLLMDENGALFSGPYARNLVRRRFIDQAERTSGAPEDQPIQDDWTMFVLINKDDDKLITLTRTSSMIYLKHGNQTQKFEVYEVDKDNVRLSEFLKDKKLRPDYGKVYYEVDPTHPVEDFVYYKEVVVLRRPKSGGFFSRKPRTEFPVSGIVDCEFRSLYKLHKKIPDEDIKIQSDSDLKYFIQSLSQGSRCLKRGQCVLIMKEKENKVIHGTV